MKRLVKYLAFSVIAVSVAFAVFKFNNKYMIDIMNKNIEWEIMLKGVKGAKSFDFDEDGNLYIAFSDSIKIIKSDGKDEMLIRKSDFNIYDMAVYKSSIILANGRDVIEYNYDNDQITKLIEDMPNTGKNKYTKLLVMNDSLYVTIGSNTNSGILDSDKLDCDVPSFEWVLTGKNYGENNTGAFAGYGVSSKAGEKVKEGTVSNGTIICYDLQNSRTSTYATGIRNIEGLDFNNEGEIIAIVGGIEDEGSRAIKDDKDYIYKIKENAWYGWPDYSGGDSVTSPRFSDGSIIVDALISNPPTKVPYGPIYQHTSISSLKGLAIDRTGSVLGDGCVVFADNDANYLYGLSKDNVASKVVDLGSNSNVEEIRSYDDGIYVLDSSIGFLYKLSGKKNDNIFTLPIIIWAFVILFIISLVVILFLKTKDNLKRTSR